MRRFGLFYPIHLWLLANKLLYTNQYLQSFDSLKPRLSGITEETSNHLLGSTAWTNNFCWFRFILKYPNSGLLFTFGLIRINLGFVPSNDIVDQIWPWLNFLSISLFHLTRACFRASVKLCGIQRLLFRTLKWSFKSYVLLSCQCLRMSESRGMLYAGLAQSFHAQLQVATTDVDGRPSRNSSLRKVRPRWNSKPIINSPIGWCFIPKSQMKSIDALFRS